MKTLSLALTLVLLAGVAFAETVPVTYYDRDSHRGHNHDAIRQTTATVHDKTPDYGPHPAFNQPDNIDIIAELDAPKLVQFTDNWYLGSSLGKDLNSTSFGEGWEATAKVTYTGSLFSFKK